jgi:putative FmdB family regulatory protein
MGEVFGRSRIGAICNLDAVAVSFAGGVLARSGRVLRSAVALCYDTPRFKMPIYEYQCRNCANEFELLILKSSPAPACPSCQSEDIEQLLSGFAVSSEGISKSRLQAAQRKYAVSSKVKDQKVAEVEYFKKEREEHGGG